MTDGELVLFAVAIASIIGGNNLVAIASGGMFILCLIAPPSVFSILDRFGVPAGVTFLTVGLLLPFATGNLGLSAVTQTLWSRAGIIAILVGTASSYLAAGGIRLLMAHPEVMVGLVIGSIIGVSFFGGIPVGPLVAAGLTAALFGLLRI